jgi:hypothetical protein
VVERRHDGSEEWQWRASWRASARAREGAREWSGEVQGALGVELSFYKGRGRSGKWQRVVTSGLMAFKPLMARGG